MRGLLLIDVDGPLNPYAAKPERRPPGYATFRYTMDGGWHAGKAARRHKGLRVWLHPGHGAMLSALAAETGLEMVWATTWLREANTLAGPAVGLPELPVIEFPEADLERIGPNRYRWRRDGRWKWPGVADYAAGRPLAWLDDELGEQAGREEFDERRAGSPTLLCHVDPRTGPLPEHLDEVRSWAHDLGRTSKS